MLMISNEKLTVTISSDLDESTVVERTRRYFLESGYRELYDEKPVLKFKRAQKTRNVPLELVKTVFTGGIASDMDPNNRYSLVRVQIQPVLSSTSIRARFETPNYVPQTFFNREIIAKQIGAFKKAVEQNIVEPIQMQNARRRYMVSYFKSLGLVIGNLGLWVGTLLLLFNIFEGSDTRGIVFLASTCFYIGLALLLAYLYKKRIERKLSSTETNKGVFFK